MTSITDAELDEFYEDFSGWKITDQELDDELEKVRKNEDVKARRIIKQNQYFRSLLRNIVELSDKDEDIGYLLDLARRALQNTR